jgi:hypothetical protein
LIIFSRWFTFSKENEDFIDQPKNFCTLAVNGNPSIDRGVEDLYGEHAKPGEAGNGSGWTPRNLLQNPCFHHPKDQ